MAEPKFGMDWLPIIPGCCCCCGIWREDPDDIEEKGELATGKEGAVYDR